MTHTIDIAAGAHAFGDGNHPTTRGVLTALAAMQGFAPRMACDMGAGSGVLSLAIAKQFGCPVVAVELAREAVATIAENAAHNGLAALILPIHADGFRHAEIAAHAPYDLIVANMLAEPLVALAKAMAAHLAEGGVLIISGILTWQESQIRAVYETLGLELASRVAIADWVTLGWGKPMQHDFLVN